MRRAPEPTKPPPSREDLQAEKADRKREKEEATALRRKASFRYTYLHDTLTEVGKNVAFFTPIIVSILATAQLVLWACTSIWGWDADTKDPDKAMHGFMATLSWAALVWMAAAVVAGVSYAVRRNYLVRKKAWEEDQKVTGDLEWVMETALKGYKPSPFSLDNRQSSTLHSHGYVDPYRKVDITSPKYVKAERQNDLREPTGD